MKKYLQGLCLISLLFLTACTNSSNNTVYQTSTIDALLAGVYDGDVSMGNLLRHGNFGIGTVDNLDGEMIILDGSIYQVKSNGNVYRPIPEMETPFATVCFFKTDQWFEVQHGTTFQELENVINKNAPNQNLFYAIKIEGTFKQMKTRSVPGQKKPYPPLKEVTKNQPEFSMSNISGTIVGFRCPPFVKGINVPGYHLHFISDDLKKGGHVLSFEIDSAITQLDQIDRYVLQLPSEGSAFAQTDLSKDRAKELQDVEREKKK